MVADLRYDHASPVPLQGRACEVRLESARVYPRKLPHCFHRSVCSPLFDSTTSGDNITSVIDKLGLPLGGICLDTCDLRLDALTDYRVEKELPFWSVGGEKAW